MFVNANTRTAIQGVNQQLKKYYTACHNARNKMPAVEQHITLRLLPKVEEIVMNDILEGGKHDIKYLEHNKQQVLFTAESAFCNYEGAKGILMERFNCPLEGNFDMIKEGKNIIQMIDDLETMSAAEFSKKYYTAPSYKGIDKLIASIEEAYNPDTFKTTAESLKSLAGHFEFDDKMKFAFMRFCISNQENIDTECKNNTLYLSGIPVVKAGVKIVARRENYSEDLNVKSLAFTFSPNKQDSLYGFVLGGDTPERYALRINVPPELGKQLGKTLTDTYYIPKCINVWREKFKESGKPFPPDTDTQKKPMKGTDYNDR